MRHSVVAQINRVYMFSGHKINVRMKKLHSYGITAISGGAEAPCLPTPLPMKLLVHFYRC